RGGCLLSELHRPRGLTEKRADDIVILLGSIHPRSGHYFNLVNLAFVILTSCHPAAAPSSYTPQLSSHLKGHAGKKDTRSNPLWKSLQHSIGVDSYFQSSLAVAFEAINAVWRLQ
ncbi:unnamed protein product, partial [Pylaiella littoralis]